jgi:amino acid adenylation domain-containing protein
MFFNTIVVRLKYDSGTTFRELVRQCNEAAMNAISHQDLPFERVVEIIRPDRATGANPLFQVDFAWQSNLGAPAELEGIQSEKIRMKERAAIFDLSVNLWDNGEIIEGEIDYNTDLLTHETILRVRDHFMTLVMNLAENPDKPVGYITMITEAEERTISEINETTTDFPKDKTPVKLFEENVLLYPDKPAAVFKEKVLTYRELNDRANQLARTLRDKGVTRNTPVGLFTGKSVEMIVGILGILKAGGGYVPMDPEYPDQRLEFIIHDSECRILLTQEDKIGRIDNGEITKLNLDAPETYHKDSSDIDNIGDPQDLAYIIYTSGTTGLPKGTPIPQCGIVRLVCKTNYIDIRPDDRVLQTSAIVFDASVEEIFGALLNGASLFIIDKETLLDPDSLGRVLDKNNITYVDLTSSLFTQIAELRTDIFSKVKCLVLGGDVVSPPHVNKARKDNPGLTVVNTYGPTENSCNSTAYKIERDYFNNIPIGKPVSNTRAYVLDRNMNHQPAGIMGELYVGGIGLSKGYLNREDLNLKSFVEDPYNKGEKLYRTGDRVRWLPDGNIEFNGRFDNQLKIRGFRVELEEIESVISEVDGVIETVIRPVKVEEGDYRLVAFLNVPESFNKDTGEILAKVRSRLPGYMIPSAFRLMNGFPKTVNGKTDRKALSFDAKELEKQRSVDIDSFSGTERAIYRIWSDILKTADISVTDNFFDVGGNSLLAIRLGTMISKEFNIAMNAILVFRFPTIKGQSDFISGNIKKETPVNDIDEKTRMRKNVEFKRHR